MAMLVLIRTGDESSTIFAAVYPARGSAACAHASLSPSLIRVSVCIFIKIVEYMFAIKTPWTSKKHTNEKQSCRYWYRIYNKYSVTYFFKILFVEHPFLFCAKSTSEIDPGRSLIIQKKRKKKRETERSENNRHLIPKILYIPFPLYCDMRNLVSYRVISLMNTYNACTHHPSVGPWARALHVYIKVNRTNCLCVICDMSSDCCLPLSVMSCLLVP